MAGGTHAGADIDRVLIVGAGLAGLACAVHLRRAGVASTLLEASDGVGGRVRTDLVDGYRLDRGFQVLLSAYPELSRVLDVDALEPRAFAPGALVHYRGRFHPVRDPFRQPASALRTLFGPIGTLGDKLRVAALRNACRRGSVADQLLVDDGTTLDALREAGCGPAVVERFFRPFLGGVFLDPDLATSRRMFRFVFRMFAAGAAVLPARGMCAVPEQLAARLPASSIRLGTPVAEVAPGRVVLASGEVLAAKSVVVATDGEQAARWVPEVRAPSWQPVHCLYFAAPRAPVVEPVLILNGAGPVNNLCFPTRVAPGYGPGDGDLVSATVLGEPGPDLDTLARAVAAQLRAWFGPETSGWRHLRTYRITRALPRQEPGWLEPPDRPVRGGEGLYVAGDHLETASSHGALRAGRRAAEALLADRD